MCLLAPETKHIGILAFTNTYQSNPASYINCLCPHTHTHTRTSCTWQQRSNKPNSENTDFLENYQVLTSFDLRVVVFFLPVLHRHVRNRRQPPSSPSLLEMERRMRQTAWNADSRPGRRSRGRRQRVLAEAERSTQPWHRLLQYCTFPVHMEGKIRQLWTIPMRLNDLHDFFFFSLGFRDAASRLHSWLTFNKQARDASGSWNPLLAMKSLTSCICWDHSVPAACNVTTGWQHEQTDCY